jgi:hypothetical protein
LNAISEPLAAPIFFSLLYCPNYQIGLYYSPTKIPPLSRTSPTHLEGGELRCLTATRRAARVTVVVVVPLARVGPDMVASAACPKRPAASATTRRTSAAAQLDLQVDKSSSAWGDSEALRLEYIEPDGNSLGYSHPQYIVSLHLSYPPNVSEQS